MRLLLVGGQTVWRRDARDVAAPLGFAWPWWKVHLRGRKSALQELPTRVTQKSVLQECPARVSHESVLQECLTRVSHKSVPQECPV